MNEDNQMSDVVSEALTVLRELLKVQSESIRLQAATAILQYAGATESGTDSGEGASHDGVPDVVRATRFELVSAEGKLLAVLGEVEKHPFDSDFVEGGIGLALLDNEGRPQVRLCADNHHGVLTSQGLTIFDISGKYRVNLGASQGGGGIGLEHGTKGKFEMFVAAQSPILRYTDKDGTRRVFLALDTLQLVSEGGSVLFDAP